VNVKIIEWLLSLYVIGVPVTLPIVSDQAKPPRLAFRNKPQAAREIKGILLALASVHQPFPIAIQPIELAGRLKERPFTALLGFHPSQECAKGNGHLLCLLDHRLDFGVTQEKVSHGVGNPSKL